MSKRYIPNAWETIGKTYHVAQNHPKASDDNPGTEELPFKTISAAAGKGRDYDQVLIDEGVYREQVPIIKIIYGATKKLLVTFQTSPDDVQRVVLIDFPSPEMKTVGLVTRTFEDSDTGRKLAAVYVPTTPNPTSGYLEIVPVEKITATDWTVDEAMTFIVSGGAVTPEHMNFDKGAETKAEN